MSDSCQCKIQGHLICFQSEDLFAYWERRFSLRGGETDMCRIPDAFQYWLNVQFERLSCGPLRQAIERLAKDSQPFCPHRRDWSECRSSPI